MKSHNYAKLIMRRQWFVGIIVLLGVLADCRPSAIPHSATISYKVEQALEVPTLKLFTQKQLKEMVNIIHTKHNKLTDLSLKNNITGWSMGNHHITVTFMVNTPETRKAFREKFCAP